MVMRLFTLLGAVVFALLASIGFFYFLQAPDEVNVCDRTPQVQDAILKKLSPDSVCEKANLTELRAVTRLDLRRQGITSLKAEDFDDLDNLEYLNLDKNGLVFFA